MSPRVKVFPGEKAVEVPEGSSLLEVLVSLGYFVESLCGGKGACGRCVVQVISGCPPPAGKEKELLPEEALDDGYRLACLVSVRDDIALRVPEAQPLIPDSWTQPFEEDEGSDTLKMLGSGGFCFLTGDTKIFLGRVPNAPVGIAVDGGTTSVEALFVDLWTGKVLNREVRLNRQSAVGADVVSRIHFALASPENAVKVRKLLIDTINECISSFLKKSGLREEDLVALSLSGNNFIVYSFLGMDLTPLSRHPFAPPFEETLTFDEEGLLPMNRSGPVILFPSPGAFVGGDAVAGSVSVGLEGEGSPAMFIDVGTNTEIVLRAGEGVFVSSVPSGGAFEGASIKCGMMAVAGAVSDVSFENGVSLTVVGGGEARGISGSGLISLVACLREAGILDEKGTFLSRADARGKVPERFLWRLSEIEGERVFLLTAGERGKPPVYLTQGDVRNFQTAKSATRAGIEMILKRAGLSAEEVERIYLAGSFGRSVSEDALVKTGMFPQAFRGKVRRVGNASLRGGYRVLTERGFLRRAEAFSRRMTVVTLGGEKDFEEIFLRFLDF
ncbi:MAG: DUF4445 domain-containing protein [Deltaproteobacteria bacterium]|nr:MAG: DUF4445 domain-containing protein [Deltaproteobacteria bacterium]